mgnify:CR=1 FL=1
MLITKFDQMKAVFFQIRLGPMKWELCSHKVLMDYLPGKISNVVAINGLLLIKGAMLLFIRKVELDLLTKVMTA